MYYKYMYESKQNVNSSIYCVVNTDLKKFTIYTNLTISKQKLDLLCGIGNDGRNTMVIKVKTKEDLTNLVTILRCDENFKEI